MLRKTRTLCLAVFALAVATYVVAEPSDPARPAATASPKWDAEAAQKLVESMRMYRSLKTYQDKAIAKHVTTRKDEDGEEWPQEFETEVEFFFVAPGKFAITTKQCDVISDEKTLTIYAKHLEQYTSQEAPKVRDYSKLFDDDHRMVAVPSHPIAMLFASEKDTVPEIFPMLESLDRPVSEPLDGKPGFRIHGTVRLESMDDSGPMPVSLWLDEAGLLHEVRMDSTAMYKRFMRDDSDDAKEDDEADDVDEEEDDGDGFKQPTIVKAETITTLSDILLNEPISDKHFAFEAASDARKVSEFFWSGTDQAAQFGLIGKPAPPIEGKTLDGASFSLAALKGKVVVLDFWATWCGPCVEALRDVQKIADRYKDKPVVVVGVNKDSEGASKSVRKLLEKKKIAFTQFADDEGNASDAYHVSGIPCVALVDKDGVLQDIGMGFSDDDVAEKIDKLLKGEALYKPEELAERIADMREALDEEEPAGEVAEDDADEDEEEEEDDEPVKPRTGSLEPIAPEQLVKGEGFDGHPNTWRARRMDVEGDATPELVFPDMHGSLLIISSDGSQERRVRLKGHGYGASIQDYELVRHDGQVYWLVSSSRHSGSGMSQKSSVGLFDAKGENLWFYKPKLAKKYSAQMSAAAGDLTGDGAPEVVVSLMTYKMRKEGSNMWMHEAQRGYLLVLDWKGNVLSQRKVGGQSDYVAVLPGAKGQAATIISADGDGLRRFHFDEKAQPQAGSK